MLNLSKTSFGLFLDRVGSYAVCLLLRSRMCSLNPPPLYAEIRARISFLAEVEPDAWDP